MSSDAMGATTTVLQKLENVKRLGAGHTARCPAHDDQLNSLKVDTGDDGQVLIHCHAGCTPEAVVRALGLSLADLFPPRSAAASNNGHHRPSWVATTRYELRDQLGSLVAIHVRRDFSDGSKKVHWEQADGTTGLAGRKLTSFPLYGIDTLGDADDVVVVEGEKACDAARALGVPAVGTVTGASGLPGDESLLPLIGRRNYLWADNDDAGRAHMERIGWRLRDLGQPADAIFVLEWAKAPEKGDVADWVAAGGDVRRLRAKMAKAAVWEPHATSESGRAEQQAIVPENPHLTDLGNAKRLVERHGHDIRYCTARNSWLVWGGHSWLWDESGEVERRAKETVLNLYREAADLLDKKERVELISHARRSEAATRIRAMMDLAKSEPGIPVAMHALDADPLLLNLQNGTVDLRTQDRRAHRRDDLITRVIAFDHDELADCPRFARFLNEVVPDAGTRTWIQQFFGYAISGSTSEHVVPIAHGQGQNGKSTLVNVIASVLGPYVERADIETFLMSRQTSGGSAATPDVARLRGKRLVFASESSPGRKLNVARIKDLAGGESIVARELYGKPFSFQPQFSLWLSTNDKPDVPGNDFGLWRRLRLIPFEVTIPEDQRILEFDNILVAEESPGILNWMLDGLTAWQKAGRLPTVPLIQTATEEYRIESDPIGRWIEEYCNVGQGLSAGASALYESFKKWFESEESEAKPMNQTQFGRDLTKKRFEKYLMPGGQKWRKGISLKPKDDNK